MKQKSSLKTEYFKNHSYRASIVHLVHVKSGKLNCTIKNCLKMAEHDKGFTSLK